MKFTNFYSIKKLIFLTGYAKEGFRDFPPYAHFVIICFSHSIVAEIEHNNASYICVFSFRSDGRSLGTFKLNSDARGG